SNELSTDSSFYKNSVEVNISMEGVENNQDLKIPVTITMPTPSGVIPERMRILHLHNDGTKETIYPKITYVDEKAYMTFILTNFSDFVFYNEPISVEVAKLPSGKIKTDILLCDSEISGKIIVNIYDANERVIDRRIVDASENLYITFEANAKAEKVKVIWLEDLSGLLPKYNFVATEIK
ncbi:MAG: hypothetical protein J6C16_00690, partial [Clostridia bacterium]|nr:hypothetical protein [Clostridia bacterium]